MTTITTVGYGDMYPITDFGRFLAMVCMVLGILAMAMPITVLGSNFQTQFDEEKKREYVNDRDVLRALELGLLSQRDQLADTNTAARELSEYEYQKICKVQMELAGRFGKYTSEQANVKAQKKQIHKLQSNMKDLNTKINLILEAMHIPNPTVLHQLKNGRTSPGAEGRSNVRLEKLRLEKGSGLEVATRVASPTKVSQLCVGVSNTQEQSAEETAREPGVVFASGVRVFDQQEPHSPLHPPDAEEERPHEDELVSSFYIVAVAGAQ
jgi:hypothetical protein